MVMIKFNGVNNLINYFEQLPENIASELSKTNHQFLKDVRKSAKLRAPRDSGRLADSMMITKTKTKDKMDQWKLEVRAPYGIFQEFGFTPHVFLSDPGRPGFKTNKLPLGQHLFVKKFTPFLQPAIEHNLVSFTERLNNSMNRAIR